MMMKANAARREWLGVAFAAVLASASASAIAADADSYLRSAEEHMEANDLRAAVIELKNALQREPEHAAARAMLGQVYLKAGAAASAKKELERARDLGASRSEWVVPLARVRIATGEGQAVLDEMQPLADDPTELRNRLQLVRAQAAMALGNVDAAREEIDRAAQQDPEAAELFMARSQLAALERDFEQAEAHVREALARAPQSGEAHVLHGRVLQALGRPQEALAAYDRALELDPGDATARLSKTATLLGLRELDAAEQTLEQLGQQGRNSGLARYLRASLLAYRGRYEESQTELRELLRMAPSHAPAELLLGAVSYELGQLETATAHLSRYLARDPGHTGAAKLLGAVRLKLDDVEGALTVLGRAERDNPEDAQLLALLGTAYLKKGDHAQGTTYLTRAAELAPDVAALRTQLGIGHLGSGQSDQALKDLQAAVELDPDLIQADILVVLVHIREQRFEEALQAARAMAERHRESPIPYNLLGAAYLGKGDREQARQHLEKALEVEPTFDTARLNLARMHEVDGDQEAAEAMYRQVLERSEDNLQALLGLARVATQRNDTDAVQKLLEQARDARPEAPEPRLLLTRFYLSRGDRLQALAEARELADRHPNRADAVEMLGLVQMSAGEAASAVRSFRRLAELQPDSVDVWQRLATAHLQNGDPDSAYQAVERALELEPAHVPATVLKASVLLDREDADAARALSLQLQEQHPDAAIGHELQGDIETAQGRHGEAAQAYQKAYALQPTSRLALALARSRTQAGDSEGALQALRQWLEQTPTDTNVRLVLAGRLQSAGRNDDAANQYEAVLKDQPNNVMALNNIAWVHLERGDPRAAEYAARAYELQSDRGEIADTYGWILVQEGSVTEGLRLLKEAALLAPKVPDIRYHLAVALHKAGQTGEARQELERLLGSQTDFPEMDKAKALLQEIKAAG